MKRLLKFAASLVFLMATSFSMAETPNKITGIYSDMTFNKEGGDVLGIEIFVLFTRSGYWVVFQDAEGSPSEPVITAAEIKNNEITFSLPERNGYVGTFRGRIGKGVLVGGFDSGQQATFGGREFKLKRKSSYWQ